MRPNADPDPFDQVRQRLVGLAYRMLGTMAEAEDVVQDTWLRWNALGVAQAEIARPEAWLTTVCTRVALDRLKSARVQRETYVGHWLPEPLAVSPDPAEAADLADSLTFGFLTVLERLAPVDRAVFLLADVFMVPFADIAVTVGRTEPACRQIAHRARERVRDGHRVVDRDAAARTDLVEAFLRACALGDLDELRSVLVADVVLVSDGGAARHAARRPVVGFERVSRLVFNLAKRLPPDALPVLHPINGEPGFVVVDSAGEVTFALSLEVVAGAATQVRVVVNPEKLGALTTSLADCHAARSTPIG
jgi:RNA polymerase sigma-70 factor (ECF subfamily)